MRKEGYADELFLKLEEIAELCVTHKVDYALFSGDFFNSKISAKVSHSLVNAALSALDAFPCPILFIVGSHDVPYGRLDLLYKRPIGTIIRHPKVVYISDTAMLEPEAGIKIRVFPVSDSYNNTTEQVIGALEDMRKRSTDDNFMGHYYDIALLHQPVVKKGSFPYPVVQSMDLVGLADFIVFGHVHDHDGVWEYAVGENKTTFANVGAVSRGSLDEKTLARKPMVLLFEIDHDLKLTWKEIVLKSAKPAAEVFKLAEKQETLTREADIEALLQSVKETQFGTFSTQSAMAKIKIMPYSYRVELSEVDNSLAANRFDAVKVVAVELLEAL
jgi:predicted phosphodiesterase